MKITRITPILLFLTIILTGSIAFAQVQTVNYTSTDANKAPQQQEAAFTIFEGMVEPIINTGLSNFDCKKNNNGEVLLNWITAETSRLQGFHIERSFDFVSWKKLGYKDAYDAPSGEYSFKDLHPSHGVNYYRIRQIDKEGRVNYSQTLEVNMEEADFPAFFKVYPNPANGDFVNIKLPAVVVNGTYLELYDPAGRQLIRQAVAAPLAEVNISSLTRGVYLMKIQIGQTIWSRKLVVQ